MCGSEVQPKFIFKGESLTVRKRIACYKGPHGQFHICNCSLYSLVSVLLTVEQLPFVPAHRKSFGIQISERQHFESQPDQFYLNSWTACWLSNHSKCWHIQMGQANHYSKNVCTFRRKRLSQEWTWRQSVKRKISALEQDKTQVRGLFWDSVSLIQTFRSCKFTLDGIDSYGSN